MLAPLTNDTKLSDEEGRLCALDRYELLDTPSEAAFDKITDLVRFALNVPIVAVSLVARDRQWFKSQQGLPICETPRGDAMCHYTIQQREVMVIPDASADKRFRQSILVKGASNVRAYIGAPLTTPDGYNVGSLCAMDTTARDFNSAEIEMFLKFADLVAEGFELRQIASTDALTGVMSRGALVSSLDRVCANWGGRGAPVALAVLDLDHFKMVNDTHGHPAGDAVLKAASGACLDVAEPGHAFGRLGGEEFAVVMPGAGEGEALAAAERYRAAIERAVAPAHRQIRFTASVGVSWLDGGFICPERLMTASDNALYQAKTAGRNRVCGFRVH